MTSDEEIKITINVTYTPLDGRDHRFDDLREAVNTLTYHYWRLLRIIYKDIFRRTS